MIVKVYLGVNAIDSSVFHNPVVVTGEEVKLRSDGYFMVVKGDDEEYQIPVQNILYIAKIKE